MNYIQIQLTADELGTVCSELASRLQCETAMGDRYAADDFAGIISAWREFAPRYVQLCLSHAATMGKGYPSDPEAYEEERAILDETAELLERLASKLPQEALNG